MKINKGLRIISLIIGLLLILGGIGGYFSRDYVGASITLFIGFLILFFLFKDKMFNTFVFWKVNWKYRMKNAERNNRLELKNSQKNTKAEFKHKSDQYNGKSIKKEKWFSWGWFWFWVIFTGPLGALIYIVVKMNERDKKKTETVLISNTG